MFKKCLFCKKIFYKISEWNNSHWKVRKFCLRKCCDKWKIGKPSNSKTKFTKGQVAWNKGLNKHNNKSVRRTSEAFQGSNNHRWKGGRKKDGKYIMLYQPDHPFNNKNYIAEHRYSVEAYLGRFLTTKEVIHHINKIKQDNRPENLYLFPSHSEHIKYHWRVRKNKHKLISNIKP